MKHEVNPRNSSRSNCYLLSGTPKEGSVVHAYEAEIESVRSKAGEQHEVQAESAETELQKQHLQQILQMVATAAPQFADQVRDLMNNVNDMSAKQVCVCTALEEAECC